MIDAYNLLASDRVNDKEQFVHCLLVLTNCNIDSQAYEKVREWGVMALAGDGRAEYLTKTLNEADTEVLRGALVEDIHKISMVPALTDQHFAGNVSGLAMEYKLLGFEQKIKIKERFFIRGLMQRIALVGRLLELQGLASPKNVEVVFTRSMPMDTMEVAQMINLLDGVVSRETLLAQLPFINIVQKSSLSVKTVRSFLLDNSMASRERTYEVQDLFEKKIFPFPKPIELLKLFIQVGADSDSIILDFCSGSATTAHAVMQLNAEDGDNRHFIMVQLPEVCDEKREAFKAGYKNI